MTDPLTIIHGDCIEVMRGMVAESVDAIVTDPPYGLGFMGKKWDNPRPSSVCEECGNDDACEGYRVCSDCLPLIGDAAKE